ncbi:winged helix-turn-helix domain-containing protein [Chromobacterium sp. CV08]|uniref:winged helix-turn-helix domain-containing protein n=1 Tax=Chromobacterium sp. CV08 TaxID=3133274 RepID=UPI003DA8A2CA
MDYKLGEGAVSFFYNQSLLESENGEKAELRRAECELLHCLLNGITDKKEIISTVWPDTVVGNGSYNKTIFDLRSQLKQVGLDAPLIKTVPRKACYYVGNFEPLNLKKVMSDGGTRYDASPSSKSLVLKLKHANLLSHIALIVSSCALGIAASFLSVSTYDTSTKKIEGKTTTIHIKGALSKIDLESLEKAKAASRVYAYSESGRAVFFICSKSYEAWKCINQEKLQ